MGGFEKDQMVSYENALFDMIDNDWFVSDECMDFISENEYRMYEMECMEVAGKDEA